MALPRNWSDMSFWASIKGPSTSTSMSDRNSSVTSVRQCDGERRRRLLQLLQYAVPPLPPLLLLQLPPA